MTHSNDSRDKTGAGLTNIKENINIKSNESVGERQNNKGNISSSHPTKYQNLSSKIEITQQDEESYLWDRRFIEYSKKSRTFELHPKPDANYLKKIIDSEKDERYRYLIKHGKIHFIEKSNDTLFIELPQIPNILIVYRKPTERMRNPERLQLSYPGLQFKTIPLLEGEEGLKTLLIDKNSITQLDNLVSLPKLEVLDCSHNRITNISEIKTLIGLRTVCLGFNLIENIDSLKFLTRIRELDLQRNRIFFIPTGTLSCLYNLQRLNISFNYLNEFPNELSWLFISNHLALTTIFSKITRVLNIRI